MACEPSLSSSFHGPLPPAQATVPLGRSEILIKLRERMIAFAASRYEKENAEDLAQEVLMVLHEKYPHVEALEELVPLTFQILRFKLASHWRKQQRHQEKSQVDPEASQLLSPMPTPDDVLAKKEQLERLGKGISLLGPRCQDIFKLKLKGHSFPEIQRQLGADSLNTVYTWDYRCRQQLMEWMTKHPHPPGKTGRT